MVPMANPTASSEPRTWSWWRSATLAEVVRSTGSRVPARLCLGGGWWAFLIVGTPLGTAYLLSCIVCFVLVSAAFLMIVRRVGWWSLVVPYVRPVPFLGYWLWVFFAPPAPKSDWREWAAWIVVLSPLAFALISEMT